MTCCTESTVTLKTHRSGDTWRGLALTIMLNDEPMYLTGARIDMQMRKSVASTAIEQVWSTEVVAPHTAPTIEISAPESGIVSILKRKITALSNLVFDIQVTDVNGDVRTVLSGTLPVELDVTRTTT
jgi:hypothetical protein